MSNSNVKYVSGGTSLSTLLTVAFVVLKLCGIITWSWWWVFSPIWIPIVLGIGISAFVLIITAIIVLFGLIFIH